MVQFSDLHFPMGTVSTKERQVSHCRHPRNTWVSCQTLLHISWDPIRYLSLLLTHLGFNARYIHSHHLLPSKKRWTQQSSSRTSGGTCWIFSVVAPGGVQFNVQNSVNVGTILGFLIRVCLKIEKTPKPNGFADHYPKNKWLFHWEYTLFSDKPIMSSLDE